MTPGVATRVFHVMSKPTGAICNLDCEYCFFLSKEELYPGSGFRMGDAVLDAYVGQLLSAQRGADEVRAILGKAGLFSASRSRVRLACHLGCEVKSATKYAWPLWSRDASTPRRIEAAKLAALKLVG